MRCTEGPLHGSDKESRRGSRPKVARYGRETMLEVVFGRATVSSQAFRTRRRRPMRPYHLVPGDELHGGSEQKQMLEARCRE